MAVSDQKRICGMLGLAAKAGKVSSGEFSCEKAISGGSARFCMIAADASENTKKHFRDMCSYRNIPFKEQDMKKELLGHMIGKKERSVLTIDDEGFSKSILKLIGGGRDNGK